jgi:tetratricopeptide (TPR) repeat protein
VTGGAGSGTRCDFFVSYAEVDRGWAEWVAWQLEDAGFRVLVQAWDVVPGVSWVQQMHDAVQEAARTVVVLSPGYLASVYGAAEWQAAWRADPLGKQRKLVVVRVADIPRPGLLAAVVSIDVFGVPAAVARERLRSAVASVVSGRAKPVTQPPFPAQVQSASAAEVQSGHTAGATGPDTAGTAATAGRLPGELPAVWNLPPRNPGFVARAAELDQIRASLTAGTVATVQAVHGMGGVGKTQTAIEYAYRNAADYDLAWWIDAEKPGLLAGQFAALGAELGLPAKLDAQATIRAVHAELRRRGRWLLILDNAEDVNHIRPVLPGSGHILVTTRRGGFRAIGHVLDLDVLARPEAIALLQHRAPQLTQAEADTLADRLGDLPLALAQAAAYLDQTQLPPADYLRLLRTHEATLLERGHAIGHTDTVRTLWTLSLQRLQADHPAAVQLLQLCAWLAPEPIPTNLFDNHPEHLPEPLATAATDPLAFTDTIAALTDYSLARRTQHSLLLHRLVQTVTRQNQPEDSPHPLPTILTLLRTDLPDDPYLPASWPRWSQLLPHVLAATDHPRAEAPDAAADTAWLLERAANHIHLFVGDYTPAGRLLERALQLREELHGAEHPDVATTLTRLAFIRCELAQFPAARAAAERAVRILRATRGPDHPDTSEALQWLGWALVGLGEPATALPLLERALSIAEATDPAGPLLVYAFVGLGLAHQSLGAPELAQPLIEQALHIRQELYGAEHALTGTIMSELGNLLVIRGNPAAARPLLEHALRIRERAYGATAPAVAHALGPLGRALTELGEAAAARPMLEHALQIRTGFHSADHPLTANNLLWLADAVRSLDGPAAARPLLERALRIRTTAFGPDHPWTATVAISLADVLSDIGEHATAATYLDHAQQIHRNAYGNRRPGEPPS